MQLAKIAGLRPSAATEGWYKVLHIVSRMLAGSKARYVFLYLPSCGGFFVSQPHWRLHEKCKSVLFCFFKACALRFSVIWLIGWRKMGIGYRKYISTAEMLPIGVGSKHSTIKIVSRIYPSSSRGSVTNLKSPIRYCSETVAPYIARQLIRPSEMESVPTYLKKVTFVRIG